jgi:hypothetical protein
MALVIFCVLLIEAILPRISFAPGFVQLRAYALRTSTPDRCAIGQHE